MYLRQSTASQEVLLGPFLDDTDGKTAETALTIANTDIKLWKGGATTEANKNSGGATHIAGGRYYAVLDATDTDTVGMLEINVHVSGALPVRRQFYVLEEAVYDALFASSAAGYQVPIWSSAGATVNLSGTTVKTLTDAVSLPSSATINITGNITGNLTGSVGSVSGAVGSVTGNVGGNVSGSVGSISGVTFPSNFASLGINASGHITRVVLCDTITTYTGDTPQTGDSFARIGANGSGLTSLAPAATALSTATWTGTRAGYLDNLSGGAVALQSTLLTVAGYLDTEVAAILEDTGTTIPSQIAALSIPSASTNASAVRTELATELALIDVATSTRLATASYTAPLDAAGVRSAVGLAAANLDMQLTALNGYVDCLPATLDGSTLTSIPWNAAWDAEVQSEVADALAVYDPPTNTEMEARTLAAASYATASTLATVAADVVLILADTGTDGVVLSSGQCNAIADHVLRRNQSNVEASSNGDTLALSSVYGAVQQMQEASASGTTLTVKKTDGSTTLGTKTLATDAAADPVTGVS